MKSYEKLLPAGIIIMPHNNNLLNKLEAVKNRINVPLSGHVKLIVSCCFIVAFLNLLLLSTLLWQRTFSTSDAKPAFVPTECPLGTTSSNSAKEKCKWGQKECYEENYWEPTRTNAYMLQTNRGRTIIFDKGEKSRARLPFLMSRFRYVHAQWPFQISGDGKFPYFEIEIVKNSCPPGNHNQNFMGIGIGGHYYGSYGYLVRHEVPVKTFGFEGDIVGCGLLTTLGSFEYEIFFTNNGTLIDDKFIFNATDDFDGKFFASVAYNIGYYYCDLRFDTNFGDNKKKEPFKFDIDRLVTEVYSK